VFLSCTGILKVDMMSSCSWQGKGGKLAGSMVLVRMSMCCEIQVYLSNRFFSCDMLDQAHTGNRW